MNMDTMVDWQRVEALFYAAWELPAAQREQWIMAQDDSPAVRAHALALLEAAGAAARAEFLEPKSTAGEYRNAHVVLPIVLQRVP